MSEPSPKGCDCAATPILPAATQARPIAESAEAVYRIENMDCPTEEALIRSKLSGLSGVIGLDFNLMQRTLAVRHELPSLLPVEQALMTIGMQAVRMDAAVAGQTTRLSIAKMDCPTEETLIRNKLATVAGVSDLDGPARSRHAQPGSSPARPPSHTDTAAKAPPSALAASTSLG